MANQPSDCRRFFGYLSERSKGVEIPEECVACPKSLDCMLREDKTSEVRTVEHRKPAASLESLMVVAGASEQKVSWVPRTTMNVPHRSVVDLAARTVRVCGRVVFQVYCWVAVQVVSLCALAASGIEVATRFLKSHLTSVFSRFLECFLPLGRALLQLKTNVASSLAPFAEFLSLGHIGMSMSLTRRVKPAAGVLHIEALGIAVNIAWTPRSA